MPKRARNVARVVRPRRRRARTGGGEDIAGAGMVTSGGRVGGGVEYGGGSGWWQWKKERERVERFSEMFVVACLIGPAN